MKILSSFYSTPHYAFTIALFMMLCVKVLSVQRIAWISDKCSLCPALSLQISISLEQYSAISFVFWFLEESILQRAAYQAWDAQAQQQLQPTWSGGGINSLLE